jgi:16S rRNA (cytosine1402-N4)-methyltransferase
MFHRPVLLNECIEGLSVKPDGIYVDATFGGGGHARAIMEKLSTGRLIAFDQDEEAGVNALHDDRFCLVNSNFRYMIHFLRYLGSLPVDGILADLGVSSHQIDTPARGFSTRFDGPLDLRMNTSLKTTAADILNTYDEDQLYSIFKHYGELNNARKAASLIINRRKTALISTTIDLKAALSPIIPRGKENQFLAQVFQSLRIEVNAELESLQEFLEQSLLALKPGGRMAVISYHSLEDRIVKGFIRSGNLDGTIIKDFYGNITSALKPVNRKVIIPGDEEIRENPRSRSAKLRIAEKV